jgi:hypothetical protein
MPYNCSEKEGLLMLFQIGAAVIVFIHFAFVLFAVVGAVFVFKRPKLVCLHLPVLVWAAGVELSGVICPLTPLELMLRQRAGLAGYKESFVEHYFIPVLYPDALTRNVQIVLGVGLLLINVIIYSLAILRKRR